MLELKALTYIIEIMQYKVCLIILIMWNQQNHSSSYSIHEISGKQRLYCPRFSVYSTYYLYTLNEYRGTKLLCFEALET